MFKEKNFTLSVIALLLLILISYSNHFHNSFHFDDSHCIENNGYIRSLHNIPLFFKSGTTFSSLPTNQTYRPVLSTVYAIAYHLGGGGVFWFHFIIFSFFILLGVLLFFLSLKVFEISYPNPNNKYFALLASGWFMLSTSNSDTINYISSSSDSLSTFWVLLAFCLFIYFPEKRKFCFYLIPFIIASLIKASAVVFPGLLFGYVFLFENKDAFSLSVSKIKKIFLAILPSLILCILLYILQDKLNSPNWHPSASRYNYTITQPFVALYYLFTFYFPVGLSVDPDWVPLTSIFDIHFFTGIVFLLVLLGICIYFLKYVKYYPIVFGVMWYIIALLPSSLVPLEEVMNDHRAFFSNIGLVIASAWALRLLMGSILKNYQALKVPLQVFIVVILLLNAVGTFERNKVWKSEKTLWYDVTIKSPNNGRGLMNYGNVLMAEGNYEETEVYYKKALVLCPYYSYLYDNMGILKGAENKPDSAEIYFKRAIMLSPQEPSMYYFYARFLHQRNENNQATELLKQALALSPSNIDAHYLLMDIYQDDEDWQALADEAKKTLTLFPGDNNTKGYMEIALSGKSKITEAAENVRLHPTVDNYINLSLLYFKHKDYDSCVLASRRALKIDSGNILALNNMGSAYNALGEWDNAENAFKRVLKINPTFQLAINNLAWCMKQKSVSDSINTVANNAHTPDEYLNASLLYYNQGLYLKTIEACKKAIALKPDFALAYNNMCSAYNMLKMWDDGIAAGKRAVALDPNNQLAKNNLAVAEKAKAQDTQ